MTGIRRCGKSVMLELINEELTASGVAPCSSSPSILKI
jgi:predicted AAA+ superfamily ATPase